VAKKGDIKSLIPKVFAGK